jgi:hypothetical protein
MSIRLQHLREAFSFLATFTGRLGELVVDTTNNRLQVHDGVTAGGWPAAKLSEVVTNTRTAILDVAYTALASDRTIAYTAITAARVVNLPAASAYPTGTTLTVIDESGSCAATTTITLARAGSDTIDGATNAVISSAYGYLALQGNGSSKWTIIDQAASNLPAVGIGTAADPSNPLSVYGASALFNSAGNFNFTINKAASANTASTIYEDGFSARAQVGLCGDDNFHFKVSPDGSSWHDALDINASTGLVTTNFGLTISGTATLPDNSTWSSSGVSALLINNGISGNTTGSLAPLYASNTGNGIGVFDVYSGASGTAVTTAQFKFRSARGTPSSPAALNSDDYVGSIKFYGYNGSAFSGGIAYIAAVATQNFTASAEGTAIAFFTTVNSTTSAAEAGRFDDTGYLGLGTTSPAQKLDVNGAIAISGTTTIGPDRSHYLGTYTVATLPAAGTAGRIAFATNCRMFNGTGIQEGSGSGTGGLVIDNGTAWKIAGTNVTAIA